MNDDVRDRLRGLTSQRAIAKRLGITPQAVNQWFNKPHIPPRFVLPICELVRHIAVNFLASSLRELRPV